MSVQLNPDHGIEEYSFEDFGKLNCTLRSAKCGGRWYTTEAAWIKMLAVRPQIMYFLPAFS